MTTLTRFSLWQRPSTRLGWWAVRLAALFVVLFIIDSVVFMPLGFPYGGTNNEMRSTECRGRNNASHGAVHDYQPRTMFCP